MLSRQSVHLTHAVQLIQSLHHIICSLSFSSAAGVTSFLSFLSMLSIPPRDSPPPPVPSFLLGSLLGSSGIYFFFQTMSRFVFPLVFCSLPAPLLIVLPRQSRTSQPPFTTPAYVRTYHDGGTPFLSFRPHGDADFFQNGSPLSSVEPSVAP